MNNVILSGKYPQFGERLSALGYNVIYSEILPELIPYEQDHADIQCRIIGNTAFVLKECKHLAKELEPFYRVIITEQNISGTYPENVRLNAAVLGRKIIANTKSLDRSIIDHAKNSGYQLIHVNQGYAGCSCAVVSDNALITADNGISCTVTEYNIDVCKIRQGRVRLEGAECGFIGGASGLDISETKRTLYFAGNIERHPDCEIIKTFCDKHDTKICSLSECELTDIGGMIFC